MPIYEYQCTRCGAIEEAIQKFSDNPLTSCNKCSGRLHKLISQSSFHLKGTGWYVTDYAGKNSNTTSTPQKVEAGASTTGSPAEKPTTASSSSDA